MKMSANRRTVAVMCLLLLACSVAHARVTREELLNHVRDEPGNSDHYVDLANVLHDDKETVTLLPVSLTRPELYKLAIQMNPNNAVAYNNLAVSMNDLRAVTKLADGKDATMQQLFLKAIEVDPNFGPAYNNLAETMNPDQKMNYPDGRSITRRDMFVKAVQLDGTYPSALYNLGRTLLEEDLAANTMNKAKVALSDEEEVTAQRCFLRCIEQGDSPALKHCYSKLAETMADDEKVKLFGEEGDLVDKSDCKDRAKRAGLKTSEEL